MNSCADTQQVPGIPRFQAVVRAIIFRKLPMVFFSNLAARMIQPEVERGIAGSCERTQTGTVNLPLQACRKSLPYEITCVSTAKFQLQNSITAGVIQGLFGAFSTCFCFPRIMFSFRLGTSALVLLSASIITPLIFFRSGTLPFPCFKCKINLCICQSPQSNF